MAWIIKVPDGPTVSSDDFTLEMLGRIEDEADVFWSTANVFRSAKVARAFMRCALEIAGRDPSEADVFTMKVYKSAFDYVPDAPEETDDRPTKSRRKQTSRGSSTGAPTASTGPRPLLEDSA